MIPIHERFHTWQGEGVHMGRAAFFIRTFGCPMHCPWCDSAGTWHKDYIPKSISRMDPAILAEEAKQSGASFVVVTGGEPTIHDLSPLVAAIHKRGLDVHLETSGAFRIKGAFDWVTLSPKDKWAKPALSENIERADEFKLIIEAPEDLDYWTRLLDSMLEEHIKDAAPIWLHPEWSKRDDMRGVLAAITQHVKQYGDPFRAGWQLHKLYRADSLDNRSAMNVPLGGNPELGY